MFQILQLPAVEITNLLTHDLPNNRTSNFLEKNIPSCLYVKNIDSGLKSY